MQQEVLYAIYGTLGSMLLALNAFLVKALWDSINETKTYASTVNTNVAVIAAESKHITARIGTAEEAIKDLQTGERKIRDGLHSVRTDLGNRIQILELK